MTHGSWNDSTITSASPSCEVLDLAQLKTNMRLTNMFATVHFAARSKTSLCDGCYCAVRRRLNLLQSSKLTAWKCVKRKMVETHRSERNVGEITDFNKYRQYIWDILFL